MLNFGGYTDKSIRDLNEDAIYMSKTLSLFLVADGVGGLNAGDVASQLACKLVSEQIKAGGSLCDSVIFANNHLLSLNQENEDSKMATTLVAALFGTQSLEIVWVGDSRAYYFDNTLNLLTKDHSLVEQLFENDQIAMSALDSHPKRHVISQALGASDNLKVSTYHTAIPANGYFMLCSDGLHTELSPQTLCEFFRQNIAAEPLAKSMGSAVVTKKGKDNVSVIIIALGEGEGEDNERIGHMLTPPERYFDESEGCFIQLKQKVINSASQGVKTQRVASQSIPQSIQQPTPRSIQEYATKKRHENTLLLAILITVVVLIIWLVF